MEIETQHQGAVTVVSPHGPLNADEVEPVREALREAIDTSLGRFVLDAAEISFIDSAGLELLLDTTEQLELRGQTLRLCGANETLREVFDITDVGQHFDLFEDSTTAVRSFL